MKEIEILGTKSTVIEIKIPLTGGIADQTQLKKLNDRTEEIALE